MMKKWLAGLAFSLLFLLAPVVVSAHTGLQSSSPAGGSIVDKSPGEVSIEFNTDIEPLSTFEVRGEDNALQKVSGIRIDKNKMTGKLDASLPNGKYTVKWKIIGRDGHPVENEFAFTVKQSEQPVQSPQTANETKGDTKAAQPVPSAEQAQDNNGGGKTLTIVAMLLVAVVAAIVIVRTRGKRG